MQAQVVTRPAAPRVLSSSGAVRAALSEALAWCEEYALCTPVVDSARGAFPEWALLLQHAQKLRVAYVALDGLQTEPAALEHLHSLGVLRFVPAADGSFRANLFRFKRGDEVRTLVGAGRLAPAGMMAPLAAWVDWSGRSLDAFAIDVEGTLRRAGEHARVPTPDELEAYARAYFDGQELWDRLVELGAAFMQAPSRDVDLPELHVLTEARDIRAAQARLREQLEAAANWSGKQAVGHRGGSAPVTVHWCASLKLWATFGKLENRYWNAFGTARPDADATLAITVEINPPLTGIDRKMAGAFARDPVTRDVYLLHRGRIGGGAEGVGAELFWRRFRGGAQVVEPGREDRARVVVVGKLGAPDFPRDLASFVHEVGRIKRAGK